MGTAAICIVTVHHLCHRYVLNRGHKFPLNLATIGQMVKKYKHIIEIQDGGVHRVEFRLLSLFESIYVLCIKVAISLLNLALISQILKK